jgi:eukaryotic-like serine/threonine-protein kinase
VVSGTLAQATATLESAGFVVQSATEYSATVPTGQVTRTVPAAGTPLARGATVTVYVSQGPAPVAVPNVVGMTSSAAIAALNKVGLSADVVSGPPTGTVQSVDPVVGTTVPRGTAVALVLG